MHPLFQFQQTQNKSHPKRHAIAVGMFRLLKLDSLYIEGIYKEKRKEE